MSALMARYRHVEVTLEETLASPPEGWPAHWLAPERGQRVIRFTDARHDPDRVRDYFPLARSIHAEPLSLRSIFIALARQRREQNDLAHS
jgi:hypothetical protein